MTAHYPGDPSFPGQQANSGEFNASGERIIPPSADINPQNTPTIRTPQPFASSDPRLTPDQPYQDPYWGGQPYAPQPSYGPPPARGSHMPAWALIGGGAIAALVIVALVLRVFPLIGASTSPKQQTSGQTPSPVNATQTAATTNATATVTTQPASTTQPTTVPPSQITPLIPAGSSIYEASAPGQCDQGGAVWGANPYAGEACASGALQMTGLGNCNCPIGIVALEQLPSAYPTQYVAQVSVNSDGAGATNRFGFKFYQASGSNPPDTGLSRGGYTFLIAADGAWQFNMYTSDGTLTTVDTGVYGAGVSGQHTLDLSVGPSSFTFYVDGNLVATEYDTTYTSGLIDLVTESGAVVLFQNFALYNQPG